MTAKTLLKFCSPSPEEAINLLPLATSVNPKSKSAEVPDMGERTMIRTHDQLIVRSRE